MDIYKETSETYNKLASLYQDKFMDLEIYNQTYDFFCNAITKDRPTILEIGCGPGNITKYLLAKRPDFQIEGIDIAPNMIELAKKNNPTASFKVMDSRDLKELKTKYDAIIGGFCIPYLSEEDCSHLISDSKNLLNEEGLIYVSFVEGNPSDSGFQVGSSGDRVYFFYHNLEILIQLILDNGFEKPTLYKVNYEKSDQSGEVHTILIAKKNLSIPYILYPINSKLSKLLPSPLERGWGVRFLQRIMKEHIFSL